jgi:hypothetical protein
MFKSWITVKFDAIYNYISGIAQQMNVQFYTANQIQKPTTARKRIISPKLTHKSWKCHQIQLYVQNEGISATFTSQIQSHVKISGFIKFKSEVAFVSLGRQKHKRRGCKLDALVFPHTCKALCLQNESKINGKRWNLQRWTSVTTWFSLRNVAGGNSRHHKLQ